ncbi:hypothetical protein M9H77_09511 [Catharanthus roseus]|uniref:Uncharacterized protein n=1 Tax=Catharanthus roseus TaxID=4058 RepID=A0ACC0C0Y8_CATRO|nr:hypothetical protein M9H77_09511 [Catharanthus roseus]
MDSICGRADFTITELLQQSEAIASSSNQYLFEKDPIKMSVYVMRARVAYFEDELTCLRIFLDCIHKWTDIADVLHLASLVRKVEAKIQEIASKVIENTELPLQEPPPSLGFPIPEFVKKKIKERSLKWRLSKLVDLFPSLTQDVIDFKPEIVRAYDSWTSDSFEFQFNYDSLKDLVKFVNCYEKACSSCFISLYEKEFQDFNRYLVSAKNFLDCLPETSSKDLKIEVLIHVGRVGISAALRLCKWWAQQMDPFEKKSVGISVLELQQKIDLTNPQFVDMNLKLLRESGNRLENQVDEFLKCLLEDLYKFFEGLLWDLRITHESIKRHKLHRMLKSLVISGVTLLRGDAKNVQRLSADLRVVLNELARLTKSYADTSTSRVNRLQKLLASIWLMKLEIFLREQLKTFHIVQMHINEQISALNKELRHLNYEEWLKSLKIPIKCLPDTENVRQGLALMEVGKVAVACLDHPFDAKDMTTTNEKAKDVLFKVLLMVLLFRADSVVKPILQSDDQSFVGLEKNQIEALRKGLDFFTMVVQDQSLGTEEEAKLVFAHIEEVACEACSLLHSLNKTGEEALTNTNLLVSNLLKKIRSIMVELKVYLHSPNIPSTNGLGFIDSLLEKLMELLKADVTISLKHQFEEILVNLEFLKPFLRGIPEQDIEFQELKDLRVRIIDVAYEAEYYIDLVMLEDSVEWNNSLRLYHLREGFQFVKTHFPTKHNKTHHANEQDVPQISVQKESKATTSRSDETIVPLDDQERVIIDRLVWGPDQLDIVLIVGLPGIGKTTLAKQVYNCPEVVSSFDVRTWCCISQLYRKREVLLEILSHITALTDDILGMPDEDLEDKLRKLLLKNKFLIVMDDMWNTEALNDLRGSLPNDGNGSRILITSRQDLKVKSHADPYNVRQLSDADSWNLLQKKIFHEECCPEELMEIGEQIAKSCKGLPLAIIAVAGLLQKIEWEYNSWKEVQKVLSFRIVDDPEEQCRQILELSYNYLPDNLKACFLYLGAFLEDQDIPARKLMQLWIAEGLVGRAELKSLEDVAEDYLMDLIDRSLVIFSRQRSSGGAKACRVHDVLHKFCQSKAKQEKFFKVITGFNDSKVSLHDLNHVLSAKTGNPSYSTTYDDHRLCFCSQRKHFIQSGPSGPSARSLLCFPTKDKDPKCPYDISFIFQNFRLLKVLDMEFINMGTSFPHGIEQLVYLRYLAVAGYIDSIPPSIFNLWNLQTLIVRGFRDEAISLPDAIWCLKKLRHVHISNFSVISLQDDQHGDYSGLDYLVTISSLILRYGKETECILRKISNVRKMKCIFSESWDNSHNCNNFPRLEVLSKLESLKVTYDARAQPGEFSFPSNLRKLTLSDFRLPWDKISAIGKLPNLEVLKLLSGAFDGENWDMVEGEFSELKYLKLDTLNIGKWNACSDHLPKLQQLVLRCCTQMEEVPLGVAYIPTLEKVDVQWCGDHVEESVRRIKEEGDENLKVFINFSELHIA